MIDTWYVMTLKIYHHFIQSTLKLSRLKVSQSKVCLNFFTPISPASLSLKKVYKLKFYFPSWVIKQEVHSLILETSLWYSTIVQVRSGLKEMFWPTLSERILSEPHCKRILIYIQGKNCCTKKLRKIWKRFVRSSLSIWFH
jgi:hypothetical protein